MGLLAEIGLSVAQGALRGALHPFAEAGDITSAQADGIATGAGDLVQMFENIGEHPVTGNPLEVEMRALLNPLVESGATTSAKADQIAAALMDALTLAKNVTAKPGPT